MKNTGIFLLSSLVIFIAFGCSQSFLNELPEDQIAKESFYKTENDMRLAVNAAYAPLRDIFDTDDNRLWDMSTDIGTNPTGSGISDWIFYPTDGLFNRLWSNCYQGINLANIVITKITDVPMDDNTKASLTAEARFLRAIYYHTLVSNFGDVPLILAPQNPDELEVPRTTSDQVYGQITEDLVFAEQSLPSVSALRGTSDLGRATAGAASGYLSRVYLYLNDWSKAAEKAKKVIDSDEYELINDYNSVFSLANENNNESLFEVQFAQSRTPEQNFSMYCWSFSPRGNPQTAHGGGELIIRPEFVSLYEPDDTIRRKTTVFMEGDPFFGIEYNPLWSETGLNVAKYMLSNEDAPSGEIIQGVVAKGSPLNQHLMRYAEILLNYAEAEMQLGKKDEALWGINQVRKRAGIPELEESELTLYTIYHERQIEFAMEGQRLNDLRRTGEATAVLSVYGFEPSIHYVFPIPQNEIERNSMLEQNPGY
ncbi:RagB/SusD family nutrient uptake outer membrane protein [Maribellus comscasis]|uniref:RagB/SusD family nutrient uptake outer membrane protein n=1 Tax=Maribellus comscasis TaxID=2681766 RepID=A0A6I6JJT3_9BACT|nr:RagB/SusD family nutrient uptake outer membrane protein [Maribellus comscasis]QGY42541.1 RagB/SusD family nutrient uptake outer membrane protein [Maribellus comscasis]